MRRTPAAAPATVARSQAQIIGDIQRELSHKGFYDGAVDGIWGAKTDAAARDFVQAAGLKINVDASEGLLHAIVTSNAKAPSGRAAAPARNDPIAELIAPYQAGARRSSARWPISAMARSSRPAFTIQRPRRRSRNSSATASLPVTGADFRSLVRELAAMTGRPLE